VKKYLLFMTVVVMVAPLLIAGCTTPSNPSPSPAAPTATVSANTTAARTATTAAATSNATPSASPTSQTVVISGFSFEPSAMTIQRGTSVVWRNDAAVSHQIVSDTNAFSSPVLTPGTSYTHVFDQPGTYPYHCGIHPFMTGTITVQ
jgi:plastocyanin